MTQLILADADLQALGLAVLKAAASDEDRMIRSLQSNSDAVFKPTPVSSSIADWAVRRFKRYARRRVPTGRSHRGQRFRRPRCR